MNNNELGLEFMPSFASLLPFIPIIGIIVTIMTRNYLGVALMVIELIIALLGMNMTLKLIISLIIYIIAGFSAAKNLRDPNGIDGFALTVPIMGAIFCFIILVN